MLSCFCISDWISSGSTLILFFSPISFKTKPSLILFEAFFSKLVLFFFKSSSVWPWPNNLTSSSISVWGRSPTLICSNPFRIWFFDIKFKEFLNSSFICFDIIFFKSFKSLAPRVFANSSFTSTSFGFLTKFILQIKTPFFPINSFFGKFSGKVTSTFISSPFFDLISCLSKPLINKSFPISNCVFFPSLPSNWFPSTVAL